jgi:hypothetical protein
MAYGVIRYVEKDGQTSDYRMVNEDEYSGMIDAPAGERIERYINHDVMVVKIAEWKKKAEMLDEQVYRANRVIDVLLEQVE